MMLHKSSRTALGHFWDTTNKEGHIIARNVSRKARLKLAIRKKSYSRPALGNGVTLLYRRNAGNGTWVDKAPAGNGKYWRKRIAEADDYAEADGRDILNFFQAQERAKALARSDDSQTVAERVHQRGDRETNLIRVKEVSASRGKAMRAEPISLLYEKGRVLHRRGLEQLEAEMMAFSREWDHAVAGLPKPARRRGMRPDATVESVTQIPIA
jgi:hypothetical protein